jgi:hypothetical protein
MNLEDYTDLSDDYPARPRASQEAAARKRSRPTPDAPIVLPSRAPAAALIAVVLLFIGALSYGLSRTPAGPLRLPTPTSAPTAAERHTTLLVAPTNIPTPAPPARPAPSARPEPSGDVLGVSYEVLPQTGRGEPPPVVEPAPPADPPPPPEPTAWPTSEPVVVTDFAKSDIRGTCQFVGCLGQQGVDLARAETCHALFWQYGDTEAEAIPEPDYSAVRGCIWEGLYR